jgi:dipeptidase D
MATLAHLEPTSIWQHFEAICQIPRPSKKEGKILKYLIDFAEKQGLEWQQDNVGNIIIRKPGTPGFENKPWVVLQSHVDMVCEKNAGVEHNFDKDPIIPVIKGEWVHAEGTTLGADNGIGIAAQLAILEANNIEHGPIECLFTVDEETGLTGAFRLEKDFVKSGILLNLDSEDDGELFIGCAGGIDTTATFAFKKVVPEPDHDFFKIAVTGLTGGHSGDDINKGRGNANKILTRLLWNFERMFEIRLSEINGGNLRNAIAREAFATFSAPKRHKPALASLFKDLASKIKEEQKTNEPNLNIQIEEASPASQIIDQETQENLLNALYACPHGVIAMSADIPNLVETSTNLASIKMTQTEIIIATSQRSSQESGKQDVSDMVNAVFSLAKAKIKTGDGYPGWKPNVNSPIMATMKEAHKKLFGTEPKVLAIHAGLECGLIGEKYPGIDMISFGPTIRGAHSPDERIHIPAVKKFWDLTLETLKMIPAGKY